MRKFLLILFWSIFFLQLKISSVWASDFSFDYDVSYVISETGMTHVTQKIRLTNNVTEVYAQNYSLTVASEEVQNISVTEEGNALLPRIQKGRNLTTILIPFTQKVVGINKEINFAIEYDTPDIAKKNGAIWEIIIPGVERSEEIKTYTVRLVAPESFGKAAYISPESKTPGFWTLEDHKGNGISIAYGEKQPYLFTLKYHLKNTSAADELQEITLPPDTNLQKIILTDLTPEPENVTLDTDGNWLARYRIEKGKELTIVALGQALIHARPEEDKQVLLTDAEKKTYTQSQPYWEQTPSIVDTAKELKTVENIYTYVVTNLEYNYDRVNADIERLGAEQAFNNPGNSVCMEFSDLFVALARAANIPARVHHGFAFTTNSRLQPLSVTGDVLHAWPEYYDAEKKQWIQVDPTWGNTTRGVDYFHKFDFNHITFAILGERSDYPYPAGSFRSENSDKDVFVDVGEELIQATVPQVELTFPEKELVSYGITRSGFLRLYNRGTTLLEPKELVSLSENIQITAKSLLPIPPNGFIQVPFNQQFPLQIAAQNRIVHFALDGQEISTSLKIIPLQRKIAPFVAGVVGFLFCLFLVHKKIRKTI